MLVPASLDGYDKAHREKIPAFPPGNGEQIMDANLLGFLGVIATILVVGVALGGLVLKLHNDTNRRIDALAIRVSEL